MSNLNLEVGKRYLNRHGEVVTIVDKVRFTTHAYLGSDDEYYRYNGRMGFFNDHPLDLLTETDQQQPARLNSWGRLFVEMIPGLKKAA